MLLTDEELDALERNGSKGWVSVLDSRQATAVATEIRAWRERFPETFIVPCSAAHPCCGKQGLNDGFRLLGPLLFVCPRDCECHD